MGWLLPEQFGIDKERHKSPSRETYIPFADIWKVITSLILTFRIRLMDYYANQREQGL